MPQDDTPSIQATPSDTPTAVESPAMEVAPQVTPAAAAAIAKRSQRRRLTVLGVMLGAVLAVWLTQRSGGPRSADAAAIVERVDGQRITVLSATHKLDKLYPSMHGPRDNHADITLAQGADTDSILWVTGIESIARQRNGQGKQSPEFFCHSNLTLGTNSAGPEAHNRFFGGRTNLDWRLFTLVPGRLAIQLPDGFGIPVRAGERFDYYTMALNLNVKDRTEHIRFRTNIRYVDERERKAKGGKPMKAVFRRALYGYEKIVDPSRALICPTTTHVGETCGPAVRTFTSTLPDSVDKGNTIHWLIAPGKHVNRTDITEQLDLPFDTTAHYVTGHLHPYGESLELVDKTTGEVLFKITSRDYPDKLGVAHMSEQSLPKGVMLHKDRKYELVTRYHNTTKQDVDVMAILYLYLWDKRFEAPASR